MRYIYHTYRLYGNNLWNLFRLNKSHPGQYIILPKGVVRANAIVASIALYNRSHNTISTRFDNVVYCHDPGCAIETKHVMLFAPTTAQTILFLPWRTQNQAIKVPPVYVRPCVRACVCACMFSPTRGIVLFCCALFFRFTSNVISCHASFSLSKIAFIFAVMDSIACVFRSLRYNSRYVPAGRVGKVTHSSLCGWISFFL